MTGKTNTDSSSVLPLDARTARIAGDGGLAASLRESPVENDKAEGGYRTGVEPDELGSIAPHAAESRTASALSVPRASVQKAPRLNSNPT